MPGDEVFVYDNLFLNPDPGRRGDAMVWVWAMTDAPYNLRITT